MNRAKIIASSLAGVLLAVTSALLPVNSFAADGYRSATNVMAGYRDHGDYRDRGGYHGGYRDGYRYHHRYSHEYRHHEPWGRAYGYYRGPRYPSTYYYEPYRGYYAPRYYDGGRSGWDVNLHYFFAD